MYLSKLILDPRSRDVRRDLGNLQDLHRTIMKAMPQARQDEGGARSQFGVLFRVDTGRDGRPQVLVQSTDRPDWRALPRDYLVCAAESKSVDRQFAALRSGTVLIFRLLANPTRRATGRRTSGDRDESTWAGKRIELVTEADQLDWLIRQGAQNGFEIPSLAGTDGVPDVTVISSSKVQGRKGKCRMSFGAVLFEGRLRIREVEAFHQALQRGIGRGKAYGFGLLSIARVRE